MLYSVMVTGDTPALEPMITASNLDQSHDYKLSSKTNGFDIVGR